MKIKAIDTILLAHEKTDPPMRRTYALVRVEAEGGLVGYGEASSNYGHSYPTVIKTIVEDVVSRNIMGKDARDIRTRVKEMHVLLDGYLGWDGVTGQVIGAIEIALWDLVGKEAGLPISRLLGATTTSFPLYGTGTTMFGAPPDWYAKYYDDSLARGFAGVKVRLGTDIRESVERVATVREHVGLDILVMVDAYWGYSTDDALALTHKLAPYDIYFFEEPSPQYQLAGFRRLCANSPIPIAVGERVYSPSHVQAIVDAEAAHVIEPDATICGGILACLDIAAIARTNDIRIVPHVGSPTPVGLAANLHWAAAAQCELMEFDIDPYLPVLEELAPGTGFSLTSITDGRLHVPTGPGLGIDVDESTFERFPYDKGGTYAEVFPDHESAKLRRVQT